MTSPHGCVSIVLVAVAALATAGHARVDDRGRVPATVVIDVCARDAAGDAVPLLATADVEVLVDGVAVPVLSVAPAPAALNVVLLVDHSSSIPLRRTELIAAITSQWLPLLQAGDRARLAAVASPIAFGPWLNTARPAYDPGRPAEQYRA